MKPTREPQKRGRPRDPERMRRVLEAAAQQFTELGFERTSMESVAAASGVSKMTVYSYFPSKEALFDACIQDRCAGLFDLFLSAELDPGNPRAALAQVGRLFIRLMRDDQVLATHRMMYGGANLHPEVCRAFWRQGAETCIAHLAGFLRAVDARGALRIPDPARAADQFLALHLGGSHVHALLGLGTAGAEADERMREDNLEMFLRAYQAGTQG